MDLREMDDHTTYREQLQEDGGPVVLINQFSVPPEDSERFLMLFGWALGEYMWTVVSDAASALGGAPIGVDALEREAARA